jgi:lipid A 3-O-deacylase
MDPPSIDARHGMTLASGLRWRSHFGNPGGHFEQLISHRALCRDTVANGNIEAMTRTGLNGWKLAAVGLAAFALLLASARADEMNRFNLLEENDSLYFHSDKHYTQGLRLSNLGPDVGDESGWNDPFTFLNDVAPIFSQDVQSRSRRYAVLAGQSIFTPKNLRIKPPDPHDRPYAGWLYGGVSLLQESNQRTLENLEIDLGVVGPGALGRQVQNDFHQLIGVGQAKGWSNQIQHEVGGVLSYERLWRLCVIGDGSNGLDVVPQAGATVGNVFTYGDVGGMVRIGKNLGSDYGPVRIRPALSGTDYFDGDHLDGPFGFYFFAGAQGRVVGRNIFLDGNSFRQSSSIPKKTFVADFQGGFSLFWSTAFRVDFTAVRRTQEFVGQHLQDVIGTAALSFSW